MISLGWSPGAWRKEGSGERAAPGLCSPQSSPFTHPRSGGGGLSIPARLGTVPAPRTPSQTQAHPSTPFSAAEAEGRPGQTPPPGLTPTQRTAVGNPRGRREGNPRRGSRGWRGEAEAVGTWSGNVVVPGGGGLGLERGRGWGWRGEWEREGGAGPQRPLPAAAPRPGLLFGSPFGPDPRSASDSGSWPPASSLPGPRTIPNPRGLRQSWSGCRIPAQLSPPSLPSRLDIWTLGHAPTGFRKHSPPSSAARPRAARSAEPPALLQTRLPPTPGLPLPVPSLPPSPSLEQGRREGGCAPCAVPAPPPRDSHCMAGPGGGCGGARAPCGGGTRGVAVPVPM